ncbi:prolyl 4-hydroxylase subunit alpha-1-like [Liolophura sinensis]|uniref:prolyl 4-hydroxylase subunit alpha-1-like n=1 Tax=Liolophura sinensis TaxID=3198878 RepID=UPI00315844C0
MADEATVIKLYRELAGAYYQVQMPSESVKLLQECSALYPESKSVKRELQYYKERKEDATKTGENSKLAPRVLGKAVTACEQLCRGESQSQRTRPLFCRLRATDSPFTVIKEEILSWKPRIVMVHDVLSPQQTEYFGNISSDTVERSGRLAWAKETTVSKTRKNRYELDEIRTSLVDKIMNVTALTSKRYLQAVNWGLGENMKVKKLRSNLDTYNEIEYAKRFYQFPIAKWMYFLSDITGGDIVFPDLNLKVPSIKGSAVYWYNLKPNGDPETRTKHCICPTLLGSPWVSPMNLFVPNKLETTFCGLNRKSAYSL